MLARSNATAIADRLGSDGHCRNFEQWSDCDIPTFARPSDLEATHMATGPRKARPPTRLGGRRKTGAESAVDYLRKRAVVSGLLHLGVAGEITSVLRDLGCDPEEIIAQAGLDPRLFDDPDNAISAAALSRLLSLCLARTNCPHFGLLVGQRATISSLRIVGSLMLHSPTVGGALGNLVQHFHLQDRIAVPDLAIRGDVALLSYAVYSPVEHADQICDGAIASAVNVMRSLCGDAWAPSEVLLPRHRPADLKPYRDFFRAPVRFEEETAALVFPVGWLDHPVAGADALVCQVLADRIAELELAPGDDLTDLLRRMLRSRLPQRRCSADQVAELFTVHRRTLNRRLSAEGTSFKAIADEIRFEIACQLLADTDIPFSQIAAALDFSEASAFTRAFRRWSGQTPTMWRAEHREP
jgi:AraC-like DNA-binding protein